MYALLRRRFLCGEVCGEKRKWGGEGGEEKLGKPYFSFGTVSVMHVARFQAWTTRRVREGGRDIWRVLMFVSIFEIRRFIRVRWIVVRSVINIVGVGVWAIGCSWIFDIFFQGKIFIKRESWNGVMYIIFNFNYCPDNFETQFSWFFFFILFLVLSNGKDIFFFFLLF